MPKSNKDTVNRRLRASGGVAGVLSILFGSLAGCSSEPSPGNAAGAGGAVSSAGSSAAQAGAPTDAAGSPSSSAGSSMAGASSAAGSSSSGGGGAPTAGQAGALTTPGGSSAVGGGGASVSAGAGGVGSAACTRELLKTTIDSYFKALAAHDPSSLPLADNLKFTENGKASKPADAPLWKTAGALKYVHSALDTEVCMSASEAVVPDGATDIPVALRLKLVNGKVTEIETIAARAGDYTGVTSNTAALAASKDTVRWEEPVAIDKRNTRAELTGWMTKYFKQFPAGVCNTTSTCKRMENGGGNFVCGEGASCAASSSSTVLNPRLVIADVETGLGVGFTLFTGGHPDMHLFKMYGGQVYAVSAILSKGDSTGWD